jgi:flagellar hook-basal body complex protein FliE
MTALPIDPTMVAGGPEWGVGGIEEAQAGPAKGASFGDMLGQQLSSLQSLQDDASSAATDLATGKATDPTSVVMAIERAQLAMQLASTVRTKAVDSINDVFHTAV